MERESGEFLDDLNEEQKAVNNKCEADIEKLKHELQCLEVLAIEWQVKIDTVKNDSPV